MGCNQSSDSKDGKTGNQDGGSRAEGKTKAKQQNADFSDRMKFLGQVPLFKRLPKDEHPLLADGLSTEEFKAGSDIVKQGEQGDKFYIIKSGDAEVHITAEGATSSKKVADLKAGDYFGENALLRDEPRNATIKAGGKIVCLTIDRAKFQELQLHEKLMFATRKAVGAGGGAGKAAQKKPPSPKTAEDTALIAKALQNNENLQSMVGLDDARIKAMTAIAWKETVEAGKVVIEEGDLQADYFYVVADGTFEVLVTEPNEGVNADKAGSGASKAVGKVTKEGSFGELALLYLVPRAATVKAQTNATVWVFDRHSFKEILMKVSDEKIAEYAKYLDNVKILDPLLKEEKKEVAKALIEMHFAKDEHILQQGEKGNTFYILYDGEVEIIKDGASVTKLTASAARGDAKYFGEQALMNNEVRAATVKVTSKEAKALSFDRDAFDMLLGPLSEIMKRSAEERVKAVGGNRSSETNAEINNPTREKILRKDLAKIGLLGCGGFGTVELWEHKKTHATYAMKSLSKGYIVKTGMQESVMNEKNILAMTNSIFIIKLWETYNGSQSLYFLMEAALGGELYATYHKKGFHGSEKHAKYYAAGVIMAFEHMHQRRIIYRDLKPENLLMNDKGHPKLTDMGLAKFVIGKTYTTCGTPDYFAPELIASSGHSNAVDWWTLGILIFELMSGHPPFESPYPMQIYSKVMKGIAKVPFPPKCQGPVGDLVKALLKKEPSERLPVRPGGVANLKNHKWFAGFEWEKFVNQTMEPPYKPLVKNPKDIANFSARKEDAPRQIEYKDDGSGWDKEFASSQ